MERLLSGDEEIRSGCVLRSSEAHPLHTIMCMDHFTVCILPDFESSVENALLSMHKRSGLGCGYSAEVFYNFARTASAEETYINISKYHATRRILLTLTSLGELSTSA